MDPSETWSNTKRETPDHFAAPPSTLIAAGTLPKKTALAAFTRMLLRQNGCRLNSQRIPLQKKDTYCGIFATSGIRRSKYPSCRPVRRNGHGPAEQQCARARKSFVVSREIRASQRPA